MRKLFILALGLMVSAAIVVAQSHPQNHQNSTEKKAKDQIEFSSDTKVGNTILKAGKYEVSCDRETLTFVSLTTFKKVLEVPCQGNELKERQLNTVVEIGEQNGVKVLQKLRLAGSNVEHTFNN